MLPVLILQNLTHDGPGHLATWLRGRGAAFDLRNAQAGDPHPDTLQDHGALAVLGGEMSANDPLPFLRSTERLILDAMARGRPVIGHCLGGQLMARALGATIGPSPAPEVGWHGVTLEANPDARDWFGEPPVQPVFQWHYEAFALPHGATPLAGSAACPHQAFSIGPHLAMQFHVEVNATKLEGWWHDLGATEAARLGTQPTLQTVPQMRERTAALLAGSQALADRLYARWWRGVGA